MERNHKILTIRLQSRYSRITWKPPDVFFYRLLLTIVVNVKWSKWLYMTIYGIIKPYNFSKVYRRIIWVFPDFFSNAWLELIYRRKIFHINKKYHLSDKKCKKITPKSIRGWYGYFQIELQKSHFQYNFHLQNYLIDSGVIILHSLSLRWYF